MYFLLRQFPDNEFILYVRKCDVFVGPTLEHYALNYAAACGCGYYERPVRWGCQRWRPVPYQI